MLSYSVIFVIYVYFNAEKINFIYLFVDFCKNYLSEFLISNDF